MLNLGILAAGLLLLCMSLPQREMIFAPGELSQPHAQLLDNRLVSERCSLCHPNSHAAQTSGGLQDDLCLACHQQHMPHATRRSPHDLPPAQLAQLTAKWQASMGLAGVQLRPAAQRPTACATCHVEHHGTGFDLTHMSDASCQACHQRQFASLAEGHPQFENYPYRQPRSIAFDHASHQRKHFASRGEEFQCTSCHQSASAADRQGTISRQVSFEQGCARCHQAGIEASLSNSWAVLQLPSIDAQAAAQAAGPLRDWPKSAQFGFQGELSSPLRLLLAADPELHHALQRLPSSGRIEDLAADPLRQAEVGRLVAQGVRGLIREVAAMGQPAWQQRLHATARNVLGRELSADEAARIERLCQGMPPDLFRHMERHWFGNSSHLTQTTSGPVRLASQPQPTSRASTPHSPSLAQSVSADEIANAESLDDGMSGDDLLGDDLLGDDLLGDDLLGDDLLDEDMNSLLSEPEEPGQGAGEDGGGKFVRLRGALHVASGGWFVDDELLTLNYMSRGHADPVLTAWVEFVAWLDHAQRHATQTADGNMQDKSAAGGIPLPHAATVPGGCTQCHLLHTGASPTPIGQTWKIASPGTQRPFTKFNHTPHLTLPALGDCQHCHRLAASEDSALEQLYRADAPAEQPMSQISQAISQHLAHEFVDMHVEQCGACHRPGGANDACIQCHNYHVSP